MDNSYSSSAEDANVLDQSNYSHYETYPNDSSYDMASQIPYSMRPETYIVPAVFSVMFLVGLVGNGTVIYIFIKDKSMRSPPNALITSLAAGDLIVFLGALPFTFTIYTFNSWPYGVVICKLSEFLRDVSVGVTVFTLTMLSFDRYMAIAWPFHRHVHNTKRFTLLIVCVVWCASIGIAFPGAYYSYLAQVDRDTFICFPFPEGSLDWYPRVILLTKFVVLYVVPLLVVTLFYTLMAKKLLGSRKELGANDSQMQLMKTRAKVAKIVLAFVVVFAVCLLPSHIFLLWAYLSPRPRYSAFWHAWKIMGYVLTYANSCLNPLALYFISGVYRNHYKRCLFWTCCPPKEDPSYTTRQSSTRTSRTYTQFAATSKV